MKIHPRILVTNLNFDSLRGALPKHYIFAEEQNHAFVTWEGYKAYEKTHGKAPRYFVCFVNSLKFLFSVAMMLFPVVRDSPPDACTSLS